MLELEHDTVLLPPTWLVLIYRTADDRTQHEILRRLADLDRPEFTTQSASFEGRPYVVVECPGPRDEHLIEAVALDVDPLTRLVFSSTSRPPTAQLVRGDDIL